MPYLNQQHTLAKHFCTKDKLVVKANHEAFLKIKRWRSVHNIPSSNKLIKEADNEIYDSFMCFIDNQQILNTEGFSEEELQN